MSYTGRVASIIPVAQKADAEAVFFALDPDPAAQSDRPSYSVPCNATGTGAPTHWASFGPFLVAAYAALLGTNAQLKGYLDGLPLKTGGTRVPLGTVQSFKQQVKISGEQPAGQNPAEFFLAFLTANGLKRIEEGV